LISDDDDDDDDSFISVDTESEGGFGGGDNVHDDYGGLGVNIPNEGAQEVDDHYGGPWIHVLELPIMCWSCL
jgi:hypothetical protein